MTLKGRWNIILQIPRSRNFWGRLLERPTITSVFWLKLVSLLGFRVSKRVAENVEGSESEVVDRKEDCTPCIVCVAE